MAQLGQPDPDRCDPWDSGAVLPLAQIRLGQRQNDLWYLVERSADGRPSRIWVSVSTARLAERDEGPAGQCHNDLASPAGSGPAE